MSYIFQTARYELDMAIKRHAPSLQGRLLDVGAGSHDRYSRYFSATEYIRMNLEPGPSTDLVGQVEDIPAPDASFTGIVCTQVLGDVFALPKAFSEFYRVLKPGGRLLITEAFFAASHDEPHDYWRFTEHSLRRLCEEAGFRILVIEQLGRYWSVREQMRARYWIHKFNLYHSRWHRLYSFMLKLLGQRALNRDHYDAISAELGFANDIIVIAEKPII
jgi:SAM-dependent methyltransferase